VMHIMLVDDDDDFREVLGSVLGMEGHEIEATNDGVDALERLSAGSTPSLILLDMMMPRLDGEGFMRRIRRDPRTAAIPVVILSGHQAAAQKAEELGAAGCLVKPFDLSRLSSLVRDVALAKGAPAGARP
jgi:CheY-like chemotaxis protein